MENFAAVIRTLLSRIRAFQASQAKKPWPPATPEAGRRQSPYRTAPTTWGVVDHHAPRRRGPVAAAPRAPAARPAADADAGPARRGLELTVYALPAPRGLVST